MKKLISLLLSVIMIVGCFAGCEEEASPETPQPEDATPGVVTILALSDMKDFMYNFEAYVLHEYPDIKLEFEYLSADTISDAVEYETQVQRIRAEIMAGKGPDVFLLATGDIVATSDDGSEEAYYEALIPDVNEAMYNRVFLPVDEYLADAKHYRPENYPAVVMDAGKTDEGQCVFPLNYTYSLLLLDKTQMADPEFEYTYLEDILNSSDENMVNTFTRNGQHMASRYLGNIADYSEGELLVTEDEVRTMLDLAIVNATSWSNMQLLHPMYGFSFVEMSPTLINVYEYYEDVAYPMYMPNVDGGITATINTFGAINANTDVPDDAFKVLDLFYSDVVQLEVPFTEYGDRVKSFNVLNHRASEGVSVEINTISKETSRRLVAELGDKITAARFDSGLDTVLDGYIRNSLEMNIGSSTIKDYTDECMKDLNMILDE